MAGLYKKEVLIRPTSTITVQGAKDFATNWMNDTFQNVDSNKDADGKFIDYFFADVFDARDGNIYRVFTGACTDKYEMTTLEFEILDVSKFAKNEDLTSVADSVITTNEVVNDVIDAQGEHTDRLVALEEIDSTVEAVVI